MPALGCGAYPARPHSDKLLDRHDCCASNNYLINQILLCTHRKTHRIENHLKIGVFAVAGCGEENDVFGYSISQITTPDLLIISHRTYCNNRKGLNKGQELVSSINCPFSSPIPQLFTFFTRNRYPQDLITHNG